MVQRSLIYRVSDWYDEYSKDSWDTLAVHMSDICMLYLITVFLIWFDEGGIDVVARFGHGH